MTIRKSLLSLFACALTGSGALAGSHDGTGYWVHVYNECPAEMRLAVRYLSPGHDWRADHWWDLKPNSGTLLASGGKKIEHQANLKKLYMYAETISGRGHFHTDPKPEDYNLIKIVDYRFVMAHAVEGTFKDSTFEVRLNCNDS
ncbi:MAG: hypothetical protein P8Q26_11500 [Ascidiaceihabitans sp.]|nr:hypothetical protein [Ascidiaceihabitans sp.]